VEPWDLDPVPYGAIAAENFQRLWGDHLHLCLGPKKCRDFDDPTSWFPLVFLCFPHFRSPGWFYDVLWPLKSVFTVFQVSAKRCVFSFSGLRSTYTPKFAVR
jgi:hypothetical protein